jgi:transcriptional regulator of acetoin/glycerol metabolism
MNLAEGALGGSGAGTNAIETAVVVDHGVEIFAAEHFNAVVHAWTCSAAPVHDPETGRLLGVIDVTGTRADGSPAQPAGRDDDRAGPRRSSTCPRRGAP